MTSGRGRDDSSVPVPPRSRLMLDLLLLTTVSAAAVWYVINGPDFMLLRVRPLVRGPQYQFLLRLVHVVAFACWTPLWVSVCRTLSGQRWGGWHLAVPPAAAVASELVQVWLPGHVSNAAGAVASLAGTSIGFGLALLASRRVAGRSARGGDGGPAAALGGGAVLEHTD